MPADSLESWCFETRRYWSFVYVVWCFKISRCHCVFSQSGPINSNFAFMFREKSGAHVVFHFVCNTNDRSIQVTSWPAFNIPNTVILAEFQSVFHSVDQCESLCFELCRVLWRNTFLCLVWIVQRFETSGCHGLCVLQTAPLCSNFAKDSQFSVGPNTPFSHSCVLLNKSSHGQEHIKPIFGFLSKFPVSTSGNLG